MDLGAEERRCRWAGCTSRWGGTVERWTWALRRDVVVGGVPVGGVVPLNVE